MITSPQNLRLIDLSREISYSLPRTLFQVVAKPLNRLLGITALNTCYEALLQAPESEDFFSAAMRILGLSYTISDEDLARIPQDGPLFVVANHPFGGADGIILGSILSQLRPDFRFLANSLLCRVDGIKPWIYPVNPFGGPHAQQANLRAMHDSLQHLKEGGCLATFPAGEVSSFKFREKQVSDPQWSPHIARMVRQSKATVLPVFFHGRNSLLFQLAGLIHPRARTALLMRELVNKRNTAINLRIGNPIPFHRLETLATDEAMINFLRLSTYSLNSATTSKPVAFPQSPFSEKPETPIIPAVPASLIKAELETLPPEALITESNALRVYCFHGNELPHTLREIGRLREITFRAVSEGTGKNCDLDDFDHHYEHLVLYDSAANTIAGAYRLGLTDVILEKLGKEGLYTSTLFNFRAEFFMKLNPAIELGRSFIRPEYQRKPTCMPTLWRGITGFVARNPRYTRLFGPVSINPEYNDISRQLILGFLKQNNIATDLAPLVQAKNPPRRRHIRGADLKKLLHTTIDIDGVSTIVSEIEDDKKPVPVLLKHYLKLNGQLISFNIDPDFGECLDGLIVVDALKIEPKLLKAYMGDKGAKYFTAFHGEEFPELN
ncbi:MAG: lysophospholipid acyltransferase family protein [Puniceicoccales bacterium]|jgi:putative hemolysin|nr:lysophospholipid acyltransferase family protein [Puniceicoccales bacterium]